LSLFLPQLLAGGSAGVSVADAIERLRASEFEAHAERQRLRKVELKFGTGML
jgi:hypothetical protein